MVRQNVSRSRITPKGSKSGLSVGARVEPERSGSSIMVPIVMFGCLILGAAVILVNYLTEISALSTPSDWYLVVGLAFILAGIVTSTKLR